MISRKVKLEQAEDEEKEEMEENCAIMARQVLPNMLTALRHTTPP